MFTSILARSQRSSSLLDMITDDFSRSALSCFTLISSALGPKIELMKDLARNRRANKSMYGKPAGILRRRITDIPMTEANFAGAGVEWSRASQNSQPSRCSIENVISLSATSVMQLIIKATTLELPSFDATVVSMDECLPSRLESTSASVSSEKMPPCSLRTA